MDTNTDYRVAVCGILSWVSIQLTVTLFYRVAVCGIMSLVSIQLNTGYRVAVCGILSWVSIQLTVTLVTEWQCVGFCHGLVFN